MRCFFIYLFFEVVYGEKIFYKVYHANIVHLCKSNICMCRKKRAAGIVAAGRSIPFEVHLQRYSAQKHESNRHFIDK